MRWPGRSSMFQATARSLRCMIDQGNFTAQTFSKFLNRSVQAARGRKLMQIVDHLRVDHRKAVQAWLEGWEARIEWEDLPADRPARKSDAYLHHDVQAKVPRRRCPGMSRS